MQLDGRQEQMLARAAALVPPSQRDDFVRSIAGVLAAVEHAPRDCDLRDVLRHVLAARGVSVGELLPPSERHYVHDRSANAWQSWRKRPPQRPQEAGSK